MPEAMNGGLTLNPETGTEIPEKTTGGGGSVALDCRADSSLYRVKG